MLGYLTWNVLLNFTSAYDDQEHKLFYFIIIFTLAIFRFHTYVLLLVFIYPSY